MHDTMFRRCASLALGLALILLAACGGTGSDATPAAAAPDVPAGTVRVAIRWPADGRLLPSAAAEGAVVCSLTVPNGPEFGNLTLNAAGNWAGKWTHVPSGPAILNATAFPNPDGTGTALAAGASHLVVLPATSNRATLTLASEIETFTISPNPASVAVGAAVTLTATAKNAGGDVVMLPDNAAWSVTSGSGFVSLPSSRAVSSYSTAVTGVAAGQATVEVSFEEGSGSTRTTTATVTVSGGGGGTGSDGAEMILIPAGTFTMGSPSGVGDSDERPQRTIYLDAYRIHKHEVTNAQYAAFLNARQPNSSELSSWIYLPSDTTYQKIRNSGGTFTVLNGWENHPVVYVSWFGAQAYADHHGLLLPTEAQWEKAARGSADGRQYPWGDTWDRNRVNASGKSGADTWGFTSPVGSFPSGASPYGVMDMAGNVWEWCRDWYHSDWYSVMPDSNPVNVSNTPYRVLRGGSWNYSLTGSFRVAVRLRLCPTVQNLHSGFRCSAAP